MNTVLKLATPSPTSIDDLCVKFIAAKKLEDEAKRHRLEIEDQIIAATQTREEGAVTTKCDSGFSLTVTGKLSYKVDDIATLLTAVDAWPVNMRPVKTVVTIDETGCKYLRANRPEMWVQIAKFIEIKPAKFAVKVSV